MGVEVKTKNGYVKIANNLFDNIFIRDFTKRELQVILLIIRLSYGFNRKYAIIEPKARICLLGIQAPNIDRTLDRLLDKKIILSHGNNVYSLNKHYDQWEIKINKYFNCEKYTNLKALQFKKDVITEITKNDNEYYQDDNNDNMGDIITTITPCNQEDNNNIINEITPILSPRLQNSVNSYQDDNTTIITPIIKTQKTLSPRLQEQPKNTDGNGNTTQPKDIIKDNIKTSLNTCIKEETQTNSKKFDPYFNNPFVEKFKKEYERIFNKPRCYLNNFQINKIIEICAEAPEFLEKMPEILEKMKKIKFSQGSTSLKWLLESGNWAGILNGDYDKYIQEDAPEDSDEWDMGIPIVN